MFKKTIIMGTLIALSGTAFSGDNTSMRCGNGIVRLGMGVDQLKKACGAKWKPARIEHSMRTEADPRYRYSDGTIPVTMHLGEAWTYAFYGKLVTVIKIEDGRIIRINQTSSRHLK